MNFFKKNQILLYVIAFMLVTAGYLNYTTKNHNVSDILQTTTKAEELAGTENRIAVSRKDYNNSVKTLNTTIKKFPNNILAGMFGIEKATYFEADEKSSEVPNVSFE